MVSATNSFKGPSSPLSLSLSAQPSTRLCGTGTMVLIWQGSRRKGCRSAAFHSCTYEKATLLADRLNPGSQVARHGEVGEVEVLSGGAWWILDICGLWSGSSGHVIVMELQRGLRAGQPHGGHLRVYPIPFVPHSHLDDPLKLQFKISLLNPRKASFFTLVITRASLTWNAAPLPQTNHTWPPTRPFSTARDTWARSHPSIVTLKDGFGRVYQVLI